ncbi:hypothetical protein Fot_35140 [Forsythia ovata]|uniref:Reverse transcriptase domain-containing protein n=1 Tax=Forsythia ovata TaxID=205694 RepID=A0ABD1SNP5_9LAMI
MAILQKTTAPPLHAMEAPHVEIAPMEGSTPNVPIMTLNFESFLNQKVDEAISRKKDEGRPTSIKEEPFTEEVMMVPLPSKFKEPIDEFDGTSYPIDHIHTFQD